MKKFLGFVLAGAICFVVTAKASAQDYMGPKIKVSVGGVSFSDFGSNIGGSGVSIQKNGLGLGVAYDVMPSEKNGVPISLNYFTKSGSTTNLGWTAWTVGADYIWKFGAPGTEGTAASANFYAGLGLDYINGKFKNCTGSGCSESWMGGDIVAGVDFSKSFNIELKYTLTNSKNQGGGVKLKGTNIQYSLGYRF